MVLEGWACRYKLLPEGTRQITSFLMPGDCCDLHASVLERMEHSIATLTAARVAMVPRQRMEELIFTRPAITRAFWLTQLVDEDTLWSFMQLGPLSGVMCIQEGPSHSGGLGLTAQLCGGGRDRDVGGGDCRTDPA